VLYFYVALFVLSLGVAAADFVLRQQYGIKDFGFEREPKRDNHLIPARSLLPQTPTMWVAYALAVSVAGVLLALLDSTWYINLPLAVFAGHLCCFAIQYVGGGIVRRLRDQNAPTGDVVAGLEGYVTQEIPPDDYGEICFEYNGREFFSNALAVNGQRIEEFERVILIIEEDGLIFVEHITEWAEGFEPEESEKTRDEGQ
jgi:hypothetical protein